MLARRYGYTPQEIADMTLQQQYDFANDDDDSETLSFRDEKEYLEWLSKNGR